MSPPPVQVPSATPNSAVPLSAVAAASAATPNAAPTPPSLVGSAATGASLVSENAARTAPSVLSEDERTVLRGLIQRKCHRNRPSYRGLSCLTNIVRFMRRTRLTEPRAPSAQELTAIVDTFAKDGTIKVPGGDENKGWHTGIRPLPSPEWLQLYWGGIIPFVQEVLSELRVSAFSDITEQNGMYATSDEKRAHRAQGEGERLASTRLALVSHSHGYLGWEYAQGNPEKKVGAEYGRRPTIDCSGFIGAVYHASGLNLGFGGTVSSEYFVSIYHPEKMSVIKGARCVRQGTESVRRPELVSVVPKIADEVEQVSLNGPVMAGDLGLRGMKIAPHRDPDGGVRCDFGHIVMFTGRTIGTESEYIHGPDFGTVVDVQSAPLAGFQVIMRLRAV